MKKYLIKDITINLDNKRKPLNQQERSQITTFGLYPYIGANNIQDYVDEYIFDQKILCVSEDGGSWGSNQVCAKMYNEKCWVNNHAHVLTSDEEILILEFLMHYLNFRDLNSFISGSTRGKLTKAKLESIQIPLPPLSTQKAISEKLDKADALRKKDKELLAQYDELAQAIFIDMFGDPVKNEKKWKIKTLSEVCSKITDGTHDTPTRLKEGIKFITGKHIRPFSIDYNNSDYVTEEIHREIFKRCNPENEDILYTNIGVNYGTAAMNTVDYEFSMKNVALIKYDRKHLQGRYLEQLLNDTNFKDKLKSKFGVGGAQQFLSLKQIKSIEVYLPHLELQTQFSEKIQNIEAQKALVKQQAQQSEDLFQALLQESFNF